MFTIQLLSSPVVGVEEINGIRSLRLDVAREVIPAESHEVDDLASADAALDDYAARAAATGTPGQAFMHFSRKKPTTPRGVGIEAEHEREFNIDRLGAGA